MLIRSREPYDAIVIGSGMSGGMVARELCERGLNTLVLDRGRAFEHITSYSTEHKRPWELPHRGRVPVDEARTEQPTQSKVYLYSQATKHLFISDRRNPYEEAQPFDWIQANQVGGRSLMWARQTYRWSPMDFTANLEDGHGVDWPIRYEDIAPWYDYVENFVGVSGQAEGLPQLPDGQFLAPMEMTVVEKHVKTAIESRFPDRRMTIGRCAVLTEQHNGRAPCHYCGECERGCSTASYYSSVGVALPAAAATGNMRLLPDMLVSRLDHRDGRISKVHAIHAPSGEMLEFEGRLVFCCASALATLRILLNSTSPDFPTGLGNSSDVLGRYVMDHHMWFGASGTTDAFADRYYVGVRPNGIYIPRFRNVDRASRTESFVRGYGYQGGSSRPNWRRGASETGLGESLKETLRMPGPWTMYLGGFGECLPRRENHVRLGEQRDEWGLPTLITDVAWSENELAMRRDGVVCAAEMLEAAGMQNITTFDNVDEAPPGLAIHEMGGARMGRDPRTSFLNGWNQSHELSNLFVTDGACMTSSACQNPSITYLALSARTANHAADLLHRGEL